MIRSAGVLFVCVGMLPLQAQETPPSAKDGAPAETLGKITLTLDAGGHTHDIKKLVFTPDGKQIISGSWDGSIRVWDMETGRTVRLLYPPEHRGDGLFAISPDGKSLAVRSGHVEAKERADVIYLMTWADGRIERTLQGHSGRILALAFSADGQRLASSAEDGAIRIWNLSDGKTEHEFKNVNPVIALAFSPAADRLAQCGNNYQYAVRDLATGSLVPLKGGKATTINWPSFDKLAWSKDGKFIAGCGEDGVWLWEPSGKLHKHLLPKVWTHHVVFSADSRRVLTTTSPNDAGDPRSRIFNVQTGKQEGGYSFKGLFPWTATFSPNGELAATATGGGNTQILLWKTQNGALVKRLGAKSWILGPEIKAGWSSNSKTVVWKQGKDSVKGRASSFDLSSLAFGPPPAGKISGAILQQGPLSLKVLNDDSVQVLKNGKQHSLLRLPAGIKAPHSLTLVGQDRAVLSAAVYSLFLFDTQTGKLLRRMTGVGWIRSVAASPDGRLVVSLSEDQMMRVWDARQGDLLLTMYMSGNDWIAWTQGGYYAATPGGERLLGWTVNNGIGKETDFYPADRFRKQMYRPDIIKLVLVKGSVADAIQAANAALGTETRNVKVEDLLPPRAVVSVVDQSKLPIVTLKVQAEALAKEQPIISLRLMMDGRVVPGKETVVEFKDGKLKVEPFEWTIELPEGEHQFAVLARCPDSSAISPAVRVKHVNAAKLPTLHVLTVGINDYKFGGLDLLYAAPDAEALAAAFAKNCKGQPFREVKTKILINQQATAKNIAAELAELRGAVAQQDLVIVFFACHGVKHKKAYYLLTHEADPENLDKTGLSGDVLRKTLAEFKCQVLLMLDACHSAGFGEGKKLSKLGLKPATDDVARDLTDDDYGVAVMCAAMGHEKAEGKAGHGLFTAALLEALEKKPGVPVPFNRFNQRVYIHHLQAYVFDEVSARSEERQHPFLSLPWVVESFVIR